MVKTIKMRKKDDDIQPATLTVDETYKIEAKNKKELKKILEFYQNKKVDITIVLNDVLYKVKSFGFSEVNEIVLDLEEL